MLWFNGNGSSKSTGFPARPAATSADALPHAARAFRAGHARHHRTGQSGGAPARSRQRSSPFHERADERHTVHRTRRGRTVDRPDDRGKIGRRVTRFRSLQIGVSQESFGESIQRNMSWAGRDRALPPEMIPHKLFDRLFGAREEGWMQRKRSILDAVQRGRRSARKVSAARTRRAWMSIWLRSATWSAPSPRCRPTIT